MSAARLMLGLVACALISAFGGGTQALAQAAYPARPVRILVGFAPGGPADTVTRLVAQGLTEELGQQFVVENKPGAEGMIATTAVAKAGGDGYTLLVTGPTHTFAHMLTKSMPYDPATELKAVAGLASSPLVLVVRQESPLRSLADYLDRARQNPGRVSYATGGRQPLLAGELLQRQTGVKLLNVPYKGSAPLRTDLIGGQVDSSLDVAATNLELVSAGKLRILAVASGSRLAKFPDIPTFTDAGVKFDAQAWYGMLAPGGTPDAIVKQLNAAVNALLAKPQFAKQVQDIGFQSMPGDPRVFQAFMDEEGRRWSQQIQALGITPQ